MALGWISHFSLFFFFVCLSLCLSLCLLIRADARATPPRMRTTHIHTRHSSSVGRSGLSVCRTVRMARMPLRHHGLRSRTRVESRHRRVAPCTARTRTTDGRLASAAPRRAVGNTLACNNSAKSEFLDRASVILAAVESERLFSPENPPRHWSNSCVSSIAAGGYVHPR